MRAQSYLVKPTDGPSEPHVTNVTLRCPECKHGSVDTYEAETPVPTFVANPSSVPFVETRLRKCLVAACNACEFCVEIDRQGRVR